MYILNVPGYGLNEAWRGKRMIEGSLLPPQNFIPSCIIWYYTSEVYKHKYAFERYGYKGKPISVITRQMIVNAGEGSIVILANPIRATFFRCDYRLTGSPRQYRRWSEYIAPWSTDYRNNQRSFVCDYPDEEIFTMIKKRGINPSSCLFVLMPEYDAFDIDNS